MTSQPAKAKRRLLVPETVQTSAMDCGPAALKCVLEGYGIPVSYGRLREACQTDVDGTSIDTLEDLAIQLGLDAEQNMIPPDYLLMTESEALPGIVVVQLPGGLTHFVVAWGRIGDRVQVMDPGTGRRWPVCSRFESELYVHKMAVPSAMFREWTESASFHAPLQARIRSLGVSRQRAESLIKTSLDLPGWRGPAALDASVRLVGSLVRAGGLSRGGQAERMVSALAERGPADLEKEQPVVPRTHWMALPHPADEDGTERILLRGAVVVRCRRAQGAYAGKSSEQAASCPEDLPRDLRAALQEPPIRPWRELSKMLLKDGFLAPSIIAVFSVATAATVVFEAMLFRGIIDLGRFLGPLEQRLGALVALAIYLLVTILLTVPLSLASRRLGRHLEIRLRAAFLHKIPRLTDRYFHSRLTSDMAERSHNVHALRALPDMGRRILESSLALVMTTAAIAWLDPPSAPYAAVVAILAVILPISLQPFYSEKDLRVRTHAGALTRFFLDALMGLIPIRAHGGEPSVRQEHEALLIEWSRASILLLRSSIAVEGVLLLAASVLSGGLVYHYLASSRDVASVLLLVYWTLNLSSLGQALAQSVREYPGQRNNVLRLLEPLGAAEQTAGLVVQPSGTIPQTDSPPNRGLGVSIETQSVDVVLAGRTVLHGVDLRIASGEHVAIVGASGAGKSSLLGVLLGWHSPAAGSLLVDGQPWEDGMLSLLRRSTVWVDPSVQLWNRTLLANLRYGNDAHSSLALDPAIEAANLRTVLERLPDGLQTQLGEGGALVSGGEGQRVRLSRGMLRASPRLVLLDEPFRGLDRDTRRQLLTRCRDWWKGVTLLCVTHDIAETRGFPRVLVIDGGRVVEDGAPSELEAKEGSRYRTMLSTEQAVREGFLTHAGWQRWWVEDGLLKVGENAQEPVE